MRRTAAAVILVVLAGSRSVRARSDDDGVLPVDRAGRPLNLDFETGTLADWTAEGEAFAGQPIRGDTVFLRRRDMRSGHQGDYWLGGFERRKNEPTGTLTSAVFRVTQPWASFLVAGGARFATRVELVRADTGEVFFRAVGLNRETLRRKVVDLSGQAGKEIFIRLVDADSGPWGHVNFDDFRFYQETADPPDRSVDPPAADPYPYAGLAPAEAARVMQVPAGFSVVVAAGEPDVRQPVAMAIDDRGRVWVAEAYAYPQRAAEGEGRDRILVFADVDGDGRFDQRTVFAENLNLVSGLEVGFGGVWVGAAPYLLFIPDRDGDDVPDGPPEVLLDGWGYEDTHETLNAFIWGPDGWLYGCHGVFTHSRVGKPGTPDANRVPLDAAVWRYHPTRRRFEVFAHGTSNPWGLDFNDHGQAFCTACVIPHLYHMIQGGRYQRQAGSHFNPYTYRDIVTIADHFHFRGNAWQGSQSISGSAGGGHAHAGAMIYLGGAWPARYRDQIFMNNIHGQRINMDLLKPRGSGYVGSHGPDFLLTGDRASQMINLRYGPDGQVYVIDWYDLEACHVPDPTVPDRTNGRIYKIVFAPAAAKGAPAGNGQRARRLQSGSLKDRSDAELVKLLSDQNDWYVRHARRILQERAAAGKLDAAVRPRLARLATADAPATRRLRALWALHVTGGLPDDLIAALLTDRDPYVRAWTIQLVLDRDAVEPPPELLTRFATMAQEDPSAVVRLYLAAALQRLPVDARWEILAGLAGHPEDADDHNLPLMIWYAAEPLAEHDPRRALAWGLAAGDTMPELRDFMLRRIGSSGFDAALTLLLSGLRDADGAELQLTFLTAIRRALAGQRRVEPPAAWPAAYERTMRSEDAGVRLEAQALAVTFGDARAAASLRALAGSADAAADVRRKALDTLLAAKDPDLVPILQQLLGQTLLRDAALRGLAQYDDPTTPAAILSVYGRLPPPERRSALATLCGRASYARALLAAIEKKQVPGTDLTADLVRQLRGLERPQIDQLLRRIWGTVREATADKAREIAAYRKMLRQPSSHPIDLSLGRALFARTCQQCHTLFGTGGNVGPDLTGSNRADVDYLLANVVDPSAVLAKEYRPTVIATDDGRVLTGIVRAENDQSLTVQTQNETIVLPLDEVEERLLSTKSMMPEDQLKPLSEHHVRSLLAYLASPEQVPMLATSNNAGLLFNGRDLAGWSGDPAFWSVERGEIVGRAAQSGHGAVLVGALTAADFRLQLEVKLVNDAGSSGIQFRSEPLPGGDVKGYQAGIGPGRWGRLYEHHGRGPLRSPAGAIQVRKGQWNSYQIAVQGNRVRTWVNGHKCVDLVDPRGARRGIFALELHADQPAEVRFRNLQLEVAPRAE